jgi:hypothetical protein
MSFLKLNLFGRPAAGSAGGDAGPAPVARSVAAPGAPPPAVAEDLLMRAQDQTAKRKATLDKQCAESICWGWEDAGRV